MGALGALSILLLDLPQALKRPAENKGNKGDRPLFLVMEKNITRILCANNGFFVLTSVTSIILIILVGCVTQQAVPNTKNDAAISCLTLLDTALRENWHFSGDTSLDLKTIISFEVDSMSKVSHLKITKRSGSDKFDQSAVRCIEELSPFNQIDGVSNDCFSEKGFKKFVIEFDDGG
ncbi:TonB C-terminal domain-containing protein [Desulfoluna spongiiphila]|uniref:TonB C terminal n=1 Tax=Desulfoluna spongiiphila TaxID=419481 RepID=A0A1G5IPI0_9BACT|nr:TonB C-terminal domain-containing protein [Desulfoluna spongiiphila]SCY77651.1 TonB C terminal [Desulfoluna spongiiphila]